MLVNFSVKNWKSFHEKVSLSMCASDDTFLSERVPQVPIHKIGVLPIATIFGGNASGKSNLIDAIRFAEHLVCYPPSRDETYRLHPFRLDPSAKTESTEFEFLILINSTIYIYNFELSEKEVVHEKLAILLPEKEERIYERRGKKIRFFGELNKDDSIEALSLVTPRNCLFLTFVSEHHKQKSWPVFDWFWKSLRIISPQTDAGLKDLLKRENILKLVNEMLPSLDCGAVQVGSQEIIAQLSASTISNYSKVVSEKTDLPYHLFDPTTLNAKKEQKHSLERLATFHDSTSDKIVQFDVFDESDGTKRILELLPSFVDLTLSESKTVVLIDELDRSLHPQLSFDLLNFYLSNRETNSRSQLILTTHDCLLMNQNFLRRDEMWVADRNKFGVSNLTSIDEFELEHDGVEIHKDYLLGRFGGVPKILLPGVDLKKGVK